MGAEGRTLFSHENMSSKPVKGIPMSQNIDNATRYLLVVDCFYNDRYHIYPKYFLFKCRVCASHPTQQLMSYTGSWFTVPSERLKKPILIVMSSGLQGRTSFYVQKLR